MPVAVLVDDREPAGLVAALRAHPDVEAVEVHRLPAGDLAIGDVGIERKTPGDYVGSAFGRAGSDLEEQVEKLAAAYDHAYLLVEGTLADLERAAAPTAVDPPASAEGIPPAPTEGVPPAPAVDGPRRSPGEAEGADPPGEAGRATRPGEAVREPGDRVQPGSSGSGIPPASIRGSMASVAARHGVPVLPCGDRERLVDLAVRLGRKHTEDPSRRPLPPGAVPARSEPVTKRIYGCIEGIGPITAEALYEAYPTVEALLGASEADLLEVEGVGPSRAAAVYGAFRTAE